MLSYQHGFHAGNRADVLKHAVLAALLNDAAQSNAPHLYIETHAGRGAYDLTGAEAAKLGEAKQGVFPLLQGEAPEALHHWTTHIAARGAGNYPGSPALAVDLLPETSRFILFELHPAERAALEKALGQNVRVQIKAADGFSSSLKIAPRGREEMLVLVDPSYETARDTEVLIDWVPRALKRWPRATLAVWLPLYRDEREADFADFLQGLPQSHLVGVRWPVETRARTSLDGSAMVLFRASADARKHTTDIASALRRFWAKSPIKA